MKALLWGFSILLSVLILLLGLIYFLPGYDLYSVKSGSMSPAIKPGDAIIAVPPGFMGKEIESGAIVTYQDGGSVVTHRIVSMDGQGFAITRGDANEDPDPAPVSISSITGVYMFKIPYLGYINSFLRTRTGWFAAIVLPAFLLVVWISIEIYREAVKPREEKT